jgi:hypothetical protein
MIENNNPGKPLTEVVGLNLSDKHNKAKNVNKYKLSIYTIFIKNKMLDLS